MAAWAAASEEPVLLYTPHAAPMQMQFYRGGQLGAEYEGDAFAAVRGSWNRKPPAGYEVVRIDFEGGEPRAIEPFVSGFLVERDGAPAQFARLAGLAVANDGSLLVSDDSNGVIYRISRAGGGGPETAAGEQQAQAAAPPPALRRAAREALALSLLEARSDATLQVTSDAFKENQPIPLTYADYGEGISPPLRWEKGPEGTRSYALLVEDPDVTMREPFVHWTLYNILADVTSLREGVPGAPRLSLPDGAGQGRNSRGSTGYFGMRPPEGPPHAYHFQLFALDTELDLEPAPGRAAVLDALEGHVLAEGELTGTFEKP